MLFRSNAHYSWTRTKRTDTRDGNGKLEKRVRKVESVTDVDNKIGVLPASTFENLPVRARSARTTAVTDCGKPPSLTKFAVAIGNCVDPTPVMSTLTCALAVLPAAIVRDLQLKRGIYKKTAAYGHFGRVDLALLTFVDADDPDALLLHHHQVGALLGAGHAPGGEEIDQSRALDLGPERDGRAAFQERQHQFGRGLADGRLHDGRLDWRARGRARPVADHRERPDAHLVERLHPQRGADALQLGLRERKNVDLIACPSCGRAEIDVIDVANRAQNAFADKQIPLQIAVMGCVVNGPGESRQANVGISLPGSGETPVAPVYVDGEKTVTLKGDNIAGEFQAIVEKYVAEHYGAGRYSAGRAPNRNIRGSF